MLRHGARHSVRDRGALDAQSRSAAYAAAQDAAAAAADASAAAIDAARYCAPLIRPWFLTCTSPFETLLLRLRATLLINKHESLLCILRAACALTTKEMNQYVITSKSWNALSNGSSLIKL